MNWFTSSPALHGSTKPSSSSLLSDRATGQADRVAAPVQLFSHTSSLKAYRKARARFSEVVVGLNKRIDAYNVQVPTDVFYRPRISLEQEMAELAKK